MVNNSSVNNSGKRTRSLPAAWSRSPREWSANSSKLLTGRIAKLAAEIVIESDMNPASVVTTITDAFTLTTNAP